ncbi:MAG: hypothetical protein ACF8Q5_09555 [Phycisphaerales bacterium JB040]
MPPARKPSLRRVLDDFDTRDPSGLRAFAASTPMTDDLASSLLGELSAGGSDASRSGAAWLLWEYVSNHGWDASDHVPAIADAISGDHHWNVRLPLVQVLNETVCPGSCAQSAYRALKHNAYDENTFVRAWAIGGLVRLAADHPRYRRHVTPLVLDALDDPKASVRARIRRACAGAGWSPTG